jgi:hypothetical protein
MNVRLVFVVRCVGSGLCYELIICSEESLLVCVCVCVCLIVGELKISKIRRLGPIWVFAPQKKIKIWFRIFCRIFVLEKY